MPRKLNKESRWSDRPSSHKLHQRAQVNNNLSSAKLLILDFSRPSYCLVFSVKTYIKGNLEVKVVFASFIVVVIPKKTKLSEGNKAKHQEAQFTQY